MRTVAFLVLSLLASCSLVIDEDVEVDHSREFGGAAVAGELPPVILIPGVLGSRLYNTKNGEIAWGSFAASISELKDGLDLPIDRGSLARNRDDLAAYRVLDRAEVLNREGSGEIAVYSEIIEYLRTTLGYRPAFGERFHSGQNLFVFFYDWRRSNVEAALQLAEFIENIRSDLNAPGMKFRFLCVSNGGLIARYYVRHGGVDVVSGREPGEPLPDRTGKSSACEQIICLGTPHSGTMDALKLLHEGYTPSALARNHSPATIFSFPSAFELLPVPGERVFVGDGGEPLDVDLWNAQDWISYGVSVFSYRERVRLVNESRQKFRDEEERESYVDKIETTRREHLERCLKHAARFHESIAGRSEVPLATVLGATTPTLARAGLVKEAEEWELFFGPRFTWQALDPMAGAMFLLGDGVVTRRSGLGLPLPSFRGGRESKGFRVDTWSYATYRHRQMFEDDLLRVAVSHLLTGPVFSR